MNKFQIIAIVVVVVIAGGAYGVMKYGAALGLPIPGAGSKDLAAYVYDPNIGSDAKNLYQDENALYSYMRKFGPKETVAHLASLSATYGSCHDVAHKAGRIAYELVGNQSFQQCGAECHSGCYHGATEAFFHDHGTANLSENLKVICSSADNAFFSHQCVHGIGHGLMAWTSYELFDALASCDLLSERKDSCWTGVFMENIVGGLAKADVAKDPNRADHFTKYLSDDPLYPCDDPNLDAQYKSACYFLQTSRMLQIFGSNWQKIGDACSASPPEYQRSCFESMGRDVGGTHRNDETGAITACQSAPQGSARIGCLIGAAQDTFWDPSGQDHAIRFCILLKDRAEKEACYSIIFSRAPDVLASASAVRSFCQKAEAEYRESCLAYVR